MSRIVTVSVIVSLATALVIAAGGPLYRLGLADLSLAFSLIRWGATAAIAAIVLALVALFWARPGSGRNGFVWALAALAIAGLSFWMPYSLRQQARAVPPIHDITTDLADPPAFVDIAPLRADAPNPVAYAGPETAELQRKAYPDLAPVRLPAAPAEVFAKADKVAAEMGWDMVASVASEGRIEATATTPWFGFKDDVVIRIRAAEDGGSIVDVRSKSRVGRSDLGANAARIRSFLARLEG